jgi:hypothetical protein
MPCYDAPTTSALMSPSSTSGWLQPKPTKDCASPAISVHVEAKPERVGYLMKERVGRTRLRMRRLPS